MTTDRLKYEGIRHETGTFEKVSDDLTVEEALQIDINGLPFTVIMRTPGNEEDLTRGLLFTEDIYKENEVLELAVLANNDFGHITHVNINIPENQLGKGYINTRSLLSVSSCGICGKRELGDLSVNGPTIISNDSIHIDLVSKMFESMESKQNTFINTGGSHCAAVYDAQGRMLTIMEDIGRHNAVDKAIGSLLNSFKLQRAKFLLVSGRISYEIVTKCFMAQIPILAAVSAPSSLAVDYSKELGITMFAFSRNGKTTCYAHPERIGMNEQKEVA